MKRLVMAGLLFCASAFSQNTKNLTLEQAVHIGLESNRLFKVSAERVTGAEAKAQEASTAMLPTLKFEGSYRRLSNVDPFAVTVPFYPEPIELSPTVVNTYNLRLGLQQPLFTGFKLSSNAHAAEYLARAAAADNKNDRTDLIVTLTAAYWGLYQAFEIQRVVHENVQRLESYQKDTEHLLQSGLATRNDLLKIQVQLGSARLSGIDAANDVQVATMNLNSLLGQPLDTELALVSLPGGKIEVPASQANALVAQALIDRPDIQAMELRTEASKAGLTAAQGNWWPQVFLSGNYYYNRPNTRYLPTRDEFKSTWDVGVVVQFDIWNWGATGHQTEQARATLAQTEMLLGQAKDNASLEVKRQHLFVQRATEKIAVAKLMTEQSEENVRSTNDKYRHGLATSSELLDAEVAVLQARTNYTGALVEYEIAVAKLKRASGDFTIDNAE
ncbi:MAG: TolC family protein [Bacteroidota bacterium]